MWRSKHGRPQAIPNVHSRRRYARAGATQHGQTAEVDLNELQSPLDIVPDVEHPDFEAAFAALRWFRLRGVSADQAFADPALIQAYLSATYTPMEVL